MEEEPSFTESISSLNSQHQQLLQTPNTDNVMDYRLVSSPSEQMNDEISENSDGIQLED